MCFITLTPDVLVDHDNNEGNVDKGINLSSLDDNKGIDEDVVEALPLIKRLKRETDEPEGEVISSTYRFVNQFKRSVACTVNILQS
jgi:hypothetical protein